MAVELVGGAFLSSSLQFLFERIGSVEVLAYLRRRFKRGNTDELMGKLKIVFNSVLAVIEDAEQKQIRSKRVEEWLDMLQEAVFDAEDLLDFIETDAQLHKDKAESSKRSTFSKKKLRNFFSRAGKSDNRDMESKVKKLLERLEYIANQKDLLGLEKCERKNSSWRPPTTSLVDEYAVFGRESDKGVMINLLLSDDVGREKISVIPIVGMGGIGKTTLAQALCNDRNIAEHFELKAWVCVSEEFDVCRVTKALLEEVTSNACNVEGLNLLQVKLKERLIGKKFLIVLDDVWSEKSADLSVMCMPFKVGAQGSKIIVTTRSENVASIMGTVQIHHLQKLSDEACWELFVKEASGINGDFTALEDLKKIGLGKKPFPSLEILIFKNMSSLERWSGEGCSTLAILRELKIISCPKLIGDFPCSFPSLIKLKISCCEKLDFSLSRSPSIRDLDLHGCQNMMLGEPFAEALRQMESCRSISLSSCSSQISIPVGCLPSNLNMLEIKDCSALAFEFNFPHQSLEELDIRQSCNTLITLPLNYFPNIKKLCIQNLEKLESLSMSDGLCKDMTSLSSVEIRKCPSFLSFPKDGLPAPNLTDLRIGVCEKLKYLPEKMRNLFPSLKYLYISDCPEIELFTEDSLPDSLYNFNIFNCYKLTATLKSCRLKKLLNVREFRLGDKKSATESFPEEGLLPSTITNLDIYYFPCLKWLDQNELQKLTSLEQLSLLSLPTLQTIPGHLLTNSIKSLYIYKCDELQTISEGLPISLQHLSIMNCPELHTMPSELPTSLRDLTIRECPLLANKCRREKGEYWNNIAHIYCILIDDELIS